MKTHQPFQGEHLSDEDRTALLEEQKLLEKQITAAEVGENLKKQMNRRLLEINDILSPSEDRIRQLDSKKGIVWKIR